MISLEIPTEDNADSFPEDKRTGKAKYSNMFTEAKELQSLILNDAKDPSLKPFVRAQLARAYKELGEFRLRLQGKGPPKAVDMSDRKRKTKGQAQGFTEAPGEGAKTGKKSALVASHPPTGSVPDNNPKV